MIIRTAQDAAELFAPFFASAGEEKVVVAHLDVDRNVLSLSDEAPGKEDEVELPIRSILVEAIRLNSAGLIVAHNHPSGDPSPSEADRMATRLLADAAKAIRITLHDHLVFAGAECRSFRALGLL